MSSTSTSPSCSIFTRQCVYYSYSGTLRCVRLHVSVTSSAVGVYLSASSTHRYAHARSVICAYCLYRERVCIGGVCHPDICVYRDFSASRLCARPACCVARCSTSTSTPYVTGVCSLTRRYVTGCVIGLLLRNLLRCSPTVHASTVFYATSTRHVR